MYVKLSPWDMATKGDIFEGMIGYHWQWEVEVLDGAAAGIQIHQASQMSSVPNFVVDRVFRLINAYKESAVVALGSIMRPDLAPTSPTPQVLRLFQRAKPKPLGDPRMPSLCEVAKLIKSGCSETCMFNMRVEDFDDHVIADEAVGGEGRFDSHLTRCTTLFEQLVLSRSCMTRTRL